MVNSEVVEMQLVGLWGSDAIFFSFLFFFPVFFCKKLDRVLLFFILSIG